MHGVITSATSPTQHVKGALQSQSTGHNHAEIVHIPIGVSGILTKELLEGLNDGETSTNVNTKNISRMLKDYGGPFTAQAEAIKKVENEWKSVRQVTPRGNEQRAAAAAAAHATVAALAMEGGR